MRAMCGQFEKVEKGSFFFFFIGMMKKPRAHEINLPDTQALTSFCHIPNM